MFNFFKSKPKPEPNLSPTEQAPGSSTGLVSRLQRGLQKTRASFQSSLGRLFLGAKVLDAALLEELEIALLGQDLGIQVTDQIISRLEHELERSALREASQVQTALKKILIDMLTPVERPLVIAAKKPFVILLAGVNGAGKTTTIGKLAHRLKDEQLKVMCAAGDTFRAAAVEQLVAWGERNAIPVISQQGKADSASVIFDGLQAARARGYDVLIADTAGRLPTQASLMNELKKVVRVIQKFDNDAPHEILLVLDATSGQNALSQARQFSEAIPVSGLVLTKLDGSARGGVIFAIADALKLPIRFIGVGESLEDLRSFEASAFVEALLDESV